MKRRQVIQTIVLATAGAVLLPGCFREKIKQYPLKNFRIAPSQEELLESLTQTILPKTKEFIGAQDLQAREFVLRMMDDCTSPEEQKKFAEGLKAFADGFEAKYHQSFTDSEEKQKLEWLTFLNSQEKANESAYFFLRSTKRYTVQVFTTSEAYLTKVLDYKMIPGASAERCLPIKKTNL